MAVKTFSQGEVLTASDTNTFLTNGGLVYVTSATIGTAVANVTVNNAFNSTYDNYRIVIANVSCSGSPLFYFQFSGLVPPGFTNYNSAYQNNPAAGAAPVNTYNNGVGYIVIGQGDSGNQNSCSFDVMGANRATRKAVYGTGFGGNGATYFGAQVVTSSQEISFIFSPSVGTVTGGSITVYGYRKI